MSAQTATVQPLPPVKPTVETGVFKVLEDGTVLYKTCQQAEHAALRLKAANPGGDTAKKLSQVKFGDRYLAKDGQLAPYTVGNLVEFQATGLIVVMFVLAGLSIICSALGRLIRTLEDSRKTTADATAVASTVQTDSSPSIHPGLTDQQLVVLLTAAASEAIGTPVSIDKFRPMSAKDWNWAAQGRSRLHAHQLK